MTLTFLIGLIAVFLFVLVAMLATVAHRARMQTAKRAARQKDLAHKKTMARNAPGGSASNPIVITTPTLVEAKAEGSLCLRCETRMRITGHAARRDRGRRLRVAELQCPRCEARQELYFELMRPS